MQRPDAVPSTKDCRRYITVSRFCHLLIFVSVIAGILRFSVILYLCVILHECAHLGMCKLLRVKSYGIRILPYGAELKVECPIPPEKQIAISLAGPLCSLLLFVVSRIACLISDNSLVMFFGNTNLMLFLVNLFPSIPLDGGEILRSALCMHKGIINSYRLTTYISYFFALLFVVCGFVLCAYTGGNISLIIIALIIISSIVRAKNTVIYITGKILTGCIPIGAKTKLITRYPTDTLASAIKDIGFGYSLIIAVSDGKRYIGFVGQKRLIECIKFHQTFGEVLKKNKICNII